jgi:galactitol-specific phosphotransferase system IIB component
MKRFGSPSNRDGSVKDYPSGIFVKENTANNDPGAEKRRSARLLHSVPIIVTGTDALGQSFRETTATVMVSCTGCKYQSTHYVPKNSALTIEVNRTSHPKSRRIMQAHVVWVQRPSNYRDHFHIAVEFDVPGNVWGITAPPENWFAHPEDIELEIPVTEPMNLETINPTPHASAISGPYSGSFTTSVESIERPDPNLPIPGSQPHMTAVTTVVAEMPRPSGNGGKPAVATPQKEIPATTPGREITVQSVVKETLAKELGTFRAQIETQVREAIAEAVRTSLEQEVGPAIKKILEQSNASASAIVEQAQKSAKELAEKFDVIVASAATAEAAAVPKARAPRKNSKRKAKSEELPQA